MLNTDTIPARNLQKSYKSIISDVKNNKSTVILTTNNKPLAALISLDELEELNKFKAKQANLRFLQLAIKHKDEMKDLPPDLREKANDVLYLK